MVLTVDDLALKYSDYCFAMWKSFLKGLKCRGGGQWNLTTYPIGGRI